MTLGEAKELERLKLGQSANKRLKLRDEKQAEIDRTVNRRSGTWHAERTKLFFNFIAEDIEDQIGIRKDLISQCPQLATDYELQQFEKGLSGGIEAKFQNVLKSFQATGVRPPASFLSQLPTQKAALAHRIHTAARMMRLETPQTATAAPTQTPMISPSAPDYRFKIALSFPGEARSRVQNIAELLADSVSKESVLYDKWFQAEFARPNLDTYLTDLYHKHSLLLVVFLSADYERKEWCGLEWRSVRDLIKQKQDERIMLLRLDDADVSGLRSIDGFLDIRHLPDTEVAEAILERLAMLKHDVVAKESAAPPPAAAEIPDAPQYWRQRKLLGPTPIFEKIQQRPRWCIWVRPVEFRPARFRNVDQCSNFMRRFTNTNRARYPIFREDLLETGSEWVGCEAEEQGRFYLYLQRWVLFRSAQFVHNLALDHQEQLGNRTHVLEILDRVTVAYECAAQMAKDGIISGNVLLSFGFYKVDGHQLTWPQDSIGDLNRVDGNSWSEEDSLEIRSLVDAAQLVPQGRALALDASIAIYSKFRWHNPPKDVLKSEQMARFGSILP